MEMKDARPHMKTSDSLLLLGLCIALALAGCDMRIDDTIDRPVPLTEIVRVEVLPNPVAVGDSLTLRCVTKDSLATGTGYEYTWNTGGTYYTTLVPVTRIKAPNAPGTYTFSVLVFKQVNSNTSFPSRTFQVTVTQ